MPTETTSNQSRIKSIIASASGNLVEWYDFYVYSFCSLYFAAEFFPKGDRTTQLLSTAGVFAVGFFMRPVGSWIFGRMADRHGRRTSMITSVVIMCLGSLTIALLPTYQHIGVWAPILLTVVRMVQGISVGGEYGTSATYMSEVALSKHRGFLGSFQYVTLIGGQLLALLVLLILQSALTIEQLNAWGWRIPFALGAVAALVALYLRRGLMETTDVNVRNQRSSGTLKELLHHRRALLIVIGFTAGGSLSFYTYTTYMQKYLVNTAGMTTKTASAIMTAALVVYMSVQPLFGALSDRIGRRNNMLIFGALTSLCTVPLLTAIGAVQSPLAAFAMIVAALTCLSFYTSIGGLVKAELFPMQVRALGVGLSYAIGNALFGGTAEAVALWMKQAGFEPLFYWYVTVLAVVALLTALIMPDARRNTHGVAEDLRPD